MNKSKFLSPALIVIFITGVLCAWTAQAQADKSKSINPEEKDQITNTVRAYFEARYRSFSKLEMESFEGLIDGSSKGFYLLKALSSKNWKLNSTMQDIII